MSSEDWNHSEKKNVTITPDTSINEILAIDKGTAAILMASGMSCVGCVAANEPLRDACKVHGMDVEQVLEDLNYYLSIKYGKNDQ